MHIKDINELKSLYIGKTYNKLTIVDVYRLDKQWMVKCKCDCGNTCDKQLGKVVSCHTKTCGARIHKLEQNAKQSQWYKEHPEIGKHAGAKISQWYKDDSHKAIIKERSDNHRAWWNDNSSQREYQSNVMKSKFLDNRLSADYTELIEILHPKYVDSLLSGKIKREDIIETKCPLCGEYGKHAFHSASIIGTGKLKYSHALLCDKCQHEKTSHFELEIAAYVSTFYNGTCIRNDRSVLNGKELDLYYPEKKIAIEFNGDYWHSDEHKPNDYHYNKFLSCYNQGIVLISIFETLWESDSGQIKLYISDTFSDIANSLSIKDSIVNLNYPINNISKIDTSNYIQSGYMLANGHFVYTCGFASLTC